MTREVDTMAGTAVRQSVKGISHDMQQPAPTTAHQVFWRTCQAVPQSLAIILILFFSVIDPVLAQRTAVKAGDRNAADLLRAAAKGLERAAVAPRSLALFGQITTTPLVGMPQSRSLEIRILLPDKYLRIVQDDTTIEYSGFASDVLLNHLEVLASNTHAAASYPPNQLATERARFARLLLGLFAAASPTFPLTASSPRPGTECGASACLKVAGPGGFSCTIEMAADSHLPLCIRYEATVRMPPATPVVPGTSGQGTLPPPERVTIAITFEKWQRENGALLPHRILTRARGIVLEDITISRALVNPRLTARDFDTHK